MMSETELLNLKFHFLKNFELVTQCEKALILELVTWDFWRKYKTRKNKNNEISELLTLNNNEISELLTLNEKVK